MLSRSTRLEINNVIGLRCYLIRVCLLKDHYYRIYKVGFRVLLTISVLLFIRPVVSSQSQIEWEETVVVNNTPVVKGSRGKYGSEYGRMLHLGTSSWLAGYTVPAFTKDSLRRVRLQLEIARSDDNGRSWKKISAISDTGRDLDNTQLMRLKDGSILLACRSLRIHESYWLPVYRSIDNGLSWKMLSIIDRNEGKPGELGKPDKGLYEPHLYLLDNGKVAVVYANEKHVTDSIPYSQIISGKISSDEGKTWGNEIWVVYQPDRNSSRPGMSVCTRMKNDKYIVVYEVCGPEKCNVYYKVSMDGVTWPIGLGTMIPDQLGGPYILSLNDGRLVVTSNQGNFSISEDYGLTWHTTNRAWQHNKPFSQDWTQTIWSSLFQTGNNEVAAMSSVQRVEGGHNVQIRFGTIKRPQ
jgi:hypothetical protein